jgi:hypothetical protein
MLRPGEFARPASARAFTTELAWAGSPHCPRRLSLDGLIVIYHHRTFTGWTGSRMGCKRINTDAGRLAAKMRKKLKKGIAENQGFLTGSLSSIMSFTGFQVCGFCAFSRLFPDFLGCGGSGFLCVLCVLLWPFIGAGFDKVHDKVFGSSALTLPSPPRRGYVWGRCGILFALYAFLAVKSCPDLNRSKPR